MQKERKSSTIPELQSSDRPWHSYSLTFSQPSIPSPLLPLLLIAHPKKKFLFVSIDHFSSRLISALLPTLLPHLLDFVISFSSRIVPIGFKSAVVCPNLNSNNPLSYRVISLLPFFKILDYWYYYYLLKYWLPCVRIPKPCSLALMRANSRIWILV